MPSQQHILQTPGTLSFSNMPIFSHYPVGIPDISWQLSIPSLVFSIVTPLFVIARLASRRSFAGKIGADDWTIVGAVILSETVCIQMIIGKFVRCATPKGTR